MGNIEEYKCSCGAIFKAYVQTKAGHNESEEFYCPECHRQYHARASISPTVTLIKSSSKTQKDKE